jgi:hypothetical protein
LVAQRECEAQRVSHAAPQKKIGALSCPLRHYLNVNRRVRGARWSKSPSNPRRLVLVADVFPAAGETALFSNVANHSIVLRRIRVAGVGGATSFVPQGPEIRFTFQFETLTPTPSGERGAQKGVCKLPDGRALQIVVGNEEARRAATAACARSRAFDRIPSTSAGCWAEI